VTRRSHILTLTDEMRTKFIPFSLSLLHDFSAFCCALKRRRRRNDARSFGLVGPSSTGGNLSPVCHLLPPPLVASGRISTP